MARKKAPTKIRRAAATAWKNTRGVMPTGWEQMAPWSDPTRKKWEDWLDQWQGRLIRWALEFHHQLKAEGLDPAELRPRVDEREAA